MAEHVLGRDAGIDAEFLRQISQTTANLILLLEDVYITQTSAAAVGFLQRSQSAHERGFAGAVGPEQSIHPSRDRERYVIKRFDAILISFGKAAKRLITYRSRSEEHKSE